jgi:hypothetical protein
MRAMYSNASSRGIGASPRLWGMRRRSDLPSRYSIVMKTVWPSRSQSKTRTMFGCVRLCSLPASRCMTASELD